MASTSFSWETDPFFAAAEDVQQSADRMEAAYRNWIYKRALAEETPAAETHINLCNEDVALELGTTKWQLEEFAKAITASDNFLHGEDASKRYFSFIEAIQNQIFLIEEAFCRCIDAQFPKSFHSAKLDADERDQLEMFLSGGACSRIPDLLAHGAKQCSSPLASNPKGSVVSGIMCNDHNSQGFCALSGSNECVADAQDHNEMIKAGRVRQQELIEKQILQGNKVSAGHANFIPVASSVPSENAVGDSLAKLHRLKKPPSCRNDSERWKNGSLDACIKAKEDATLYRCKDKPQPDIEWGHVPEDARSHKKNSFLQMAGRQRVGQLLALRYLPVCNASGRRASILLCLGCMYFWFLSTLVPYINSMFPHS